MDEFGAGGRTRTYEGVTREIYSLLSLPLDYSSNARLSFALRPSASGIFGSRQAYFEWAYYINFGVVNQA